MIDQMKVNQSMIVNLCGWKRTLPSVQVFDFEQKEKLFKYGQQVEKSCHLCRHYQRLQMQLVDEQNEYEIPPQYIYVCTLVRREGNWSLKPLEVSGIEMNPTLYKEHRSLYANYFLSLRNYNQNQGYPLRSGVRLKFSQLEFIVLEINDGLQTSIHLELDSLYKKQQNLKIKDSQLKGQCAICYSEASEEQPLISLCRCRGSLLTHLACQQQWIRKMITTDSNENVSAYNFSYLQCSNCKQSLPKTITLPSQQTIQLFQIQKPSKPYILIASVEEEPKLYFICPEPGVRVKIGRKYGIDIILDASSISPVHSELWYHDNRFYLKDNGSRFGTLVHFQEEVNVGEGVSIQYQSRMFEFRAK